ncbi:MAG: GNAT family N-acetyltransferase [Eisenbergiella sp.]
MIFDVTAAGFLTSIAWIPYLQGKCRIERENRSEMEAIMTEEKNRETAPVQLETARMILRDHRQEDLESHHALLSDPEVMYYLPDIMTHSREESLKDLMISVEAITAHPRKEYFLRMEDKETGELIGETGYTVLEETPAGKLVHAGYFSRKKFWGKGYMTEAFRELLRFAFEEWGMPGDNGMR